MTRPVERAFPPLSDLLAVATAIFALVGAIVGLVWPSESDRDMVQNIAAGAQIGAVAGVAIALTIWVAKTAAGA